MNPVYPPPNKFGGDIKLIHIVTECLETLLPVKSIINLYSRLLGWFIILNSSIKDYFQ